MVGGVKTNRVPFRNTKHGAAVLAVKISSMCGDLGSVSAKPVVQ